jgi:maltose/maltodextrin transport system substrate-binding protein
MSDRGKQRQHHREPTTTNWLAPNDIRLRQLKMAVDLGQVMPNIPRMGRFFSAVGTALQIATDGQASAGEALREAAMNM